MYIQNNIAAHNASRILSSKGEKVSKSLERLSGGRKVNRAADDAAGLAISEKMRAQIRGMSMAQKNVQDGISLIQTADGALAGTQDVLHRMKELAVQAANDTNESMDRAALDMEYAELMREISKIAETTSFNGKMLLDGTQSMQNAGQAAFYNSEGILATQDPNVSVNWSKIGGKDYSALVTAVHDSIVPGIVNQMASILPSLSDFFTSTIQIGMSNSRGGSAYASVSCSWGLNPDQVSLNLNINLDEVDKIWKNGSFVSADARSNFESMMAHELTHAVMDVATTVGMASPYSYPGWFKEGMAQTMSGDMGWVQNLTATSTDAEIQSLLNYGSLTKNDSSSKYASGYLATMYLAWEASGKGAVDGASLAAGINNILGDLAQGKSLDTVIRERTNNKYSGLDEFEKYMGMDSDTSDFVRALRAATGNGNGSVLSQNLTAKDLVGDGNSTSTFLEVDKDHAWVTNWYPAGYSPGYGGGAYIDGNPVNYVGSDPPTYVPGSGPYSNNKGPLHIQAGGNEYDDITIAIERMDAGSIGLRHPYGFLEKPVSATDLITQESASIAIDAVTGAISMVSSQRASLGAVQNRLEYRLQSLGVSEENLASSESRIRDADMAAEMTAFVKDGILSDSARAMLTQANNMPQAVLQLLG